MWQFSLVLPWLQNFVVTYHESTLWVLDPTTSTVVGVLCLEHKISCVATNGKFVYVLCDGVTRPLARFTVHSSFLKSIQKVKAREESDAVSVSSVPGAGDESGQGMRCKAVAGYTAGEEEVEEERARERDVRNPTSEELDSTSSALERGEETDVGGNLVLSYSSAVVDTSTHDLAAHQPHSQASHQPRVHTATLNEFPEYTIKTRDTTANTTTDEVISGAAEVSERDIGQRSQISETLSQADSVSVGYQLKPARPEEGVVSTSRDSLLDAIETAGTPLSTSDPEGNHSEDSARVKDVRSNTKPVSDVGSSTTNTAPATSTSPSVQAVHTPSPTVVDPPSITGPLAMQDLAREVTGLLRPAFGKLSGLMRPQERRRDGPSASRADQHSGTATPQESPDGSVPEEEEEEGDLRGEGTGTPVELSRGPTPKLMLKLSGMLKEKVSVHVVYMYDR